MLSKHLQNKYQFRESQKKAYTEMNIYKDSFLTFTSSVSVSYSKTRIPGLLAPFTTPGSVVSHGVTPGLRNMVLIGNPEEYRNIDLCLQEVITN